MAKRLSIQRILVLTAFVLSFFALSAQTTTSDTIGSGTTTSIHSAMPGAYGYHLSAALYLGNEINHSAGDIESLSYHITYGNYPVNDGDKRIKIYLLETSDPSIDLSQTWGSMVSAATLVYDSLGCDIQWDDYWKEFVFTQPFSYGGGNLIVLVEGEACDPYPGMGDCETEIYVNNGTVNNCWNRVQDGTQVSFTTVMDSIPEGTHGNHYDRPNIFFTFNSGEPVTPDTNCVTTLPMLEDFEGYPGDFSSIPTCWTKISQEYNQAYGSYYPVINGGSMSDPNQSVMFMLMDTYSSFLVLPALDSVWSMQNVSMSFSFKSAQQNITRMVVGVMSDPSDTLTFVPVDTVWREGSVSGWEPKEINFATYADSGRHIAFWFSKANSTHVFPSCFIDNVALFETPDCTPPVQISASVDNLDATISWTYTNNAYGARVYYKTSVDSQFDSVEVYTDNYYALYNLPYNTVYQYYIVTLCDGGGESAPSQVFTFSTPCETVTQFPWTDSFENGLGCWSLAASSAGQDWQVVAAGSNPTCAPYSGSAMMKYDCWSFPSGSWGTMTSPALAIPQDMTLSFAYFKQDIYQANDRIEVFVNTSADTANATLLTTVFGYDPSMSGWDTVSVTVPVQNEAVYLIFKATSDYGYNLFMDNVTVDFYTPEDTTVVVDTVYVVLEESICDGESFKFGDGNYTTAGSYTYTSNDTVYTLTLTVNPTYNVTINDSITAGETYTQYGFNESAAGTYTQNLTTVNGCDSIITLNLTVLTGVNEHNGMDFSVAPNPANDYAVVSVKNANEETSVDLLDISGRVLRTQRLAAGESTLRLERGNLPNGIYMLRMTSHGQKQTRKVIFR